jgi:nitroreductase
MQTPSNKLGRRACLRLLAQAGGGIVLLRLPGCAYYEAESGAAFAPWDFPGQPAAPEVIAARAALLAASPHNTQPWALRVTPDAIELFADFDRHLGAMDGLRRELHIGLGCALENLVIAARARGRAAQVELLPDPAQPNFVARVSLEPAPAQDGLFDVIALRHTNRGAYLNAPLPHGADEALQALLGEEMPAIRLQLLQADAQRARFRDETIAATRAIIDDTEMSVDSERWYRHSHQEIESQRDGVTLDATGNDAATRFFGKSLGRPSRATADRYWLDGTRERQLSGSAFAILSSSADNTRADQLRAGRVYQRLQLWATAQGLAMQPLNQLAERQDREQALGLGPRFTRVLQELAASDDARAQMLFRIGFAIDGAFASPRRPLGWVQR